MEILIYNIFKNNKLLILNSNNFFLYYKIKIYRNNANNF